MIQVDAIGVVEVQYFTNALELLDAMTKAADVQYLTSEKLLGGRMVTIIVGGSISQAQAAIEAARETAAAKTPNPLKMSLVISKPHEEIMRFIVPQPQQSQTKQEPLEERYVPAQAHEQTEEGLEVKKSDAVSGNPPTSPANRTRRKKQSIIKPN